jgi:hypothetical protein
MKKNLLWFIIILSLILVGFLFLNYKSSPIIESNNISVKLFYYNPKLDQGPGGAQCSEAGLVSIPRTIPKTSTPLKDSIELLLKGATSEEKSQGITSEFPLPGVSLQSASITDGVATLIFNDPQNKTSGRSCRVNILRYEIEETAKQFETVKSVKLLPEELFQP